MDKVIVGDLMVELELGVAHQIGDIAPICYGKEYWEKYKGYEGSEISDRINSARVKLTEKYLLDKPFKKGILDIGIGSGAFIERSVIPTFGYDINPYAVEWLKDRRLFIDPFDYCLNGFVGITLFDVFEHMIDPDLLLSRIGSGTYLFISIPIFDNLLKIHQSKHYRPNEHFWYFTAEGLCKWMKNWSFNILEISDAETRAGRDSILSFVFQKA